MQNVKREKILIFEIVPITHCLYISITVMFSSKSISLQFQSTVIYSLIQFQLVFTVSVLQLCNRYLSGTSPSMQYDLLFGFSSDTCDTKGVELQVRLKWGV